MVDNFADKRISDFMYQGMDFMEDDPLSGAFSSDQQETGENQSTDKTSTGGRLRQMS